MNLYALTGTPWACIMQIRARRSTPIVFVKARSERSGLFVFGKPAVRMLPELRGRRAAVALIRQAFFYPRSKRCRITGSQTGRDLSPRTSIRTATALGELSPPCRPLAPAGRSSAQRARIQGVAQLAEFRVWGAAVAGSWPATLTRFGAAGRKDVTRRPNHAAVAQLAEHRPCKEIHAIR